ncbi:MAG: hypothetical protein QNL16_06760 [Rhodobacterales bacterium]|jgi:hypothetical protein|nr:hypothetical protein [Pseudomonadota bacterium]MDA1285874.1 hypothetical protein [Pseudomonadota bacterium]NQW13876.1 hypothetical protein [Rhodobacter sp.]HBN31493.1 hypothetical protein [Paracoccaceae bacterium]
MTKLIEWLTTLRGFFLAVAETGLALVAFVLVVYLLLGGDSGDYVISVVTNVGLLVQAISAQALVALALIVAVAMLVRNKF